MNDENEKKAGLGPDEEGAPDTEIDSEEYEEQEDEAGTSEPTSPAAAVSRAGEKSGEKKSKKAKIEKKESLFAEVNGEFKKIVWAPRRELVKQTTTVVIVALMFGVIIFAMDTVFGFGVTSFIDLMIG